MNKIIKIHLIKNFLKVITNVILAFLSLAVILNLFEEIEFFKDLEVNISIPFLLTLLFIPNLILKLLPFIIFLSAMWYLISINNSKEMITLKVFGFSNFRIVLILALTAFLFGLITLVVLNPITSVMVKSYEEVKSKYSKYIDHLVTINKNGVWIKEINNDQLRIVNAKKIKSNFLNEVSIYILNDEYQINRRIEADKIDISNSLWKIKNAKIYDFKDGETIEYTELKDYQLKSLYDVVKINSLHGHLDTISFLNLVSDYDELSKKGYSDRLLLEKLNTFISLPIFLFIMVFLASIFTMKTSSKPQNLYYIFISIISSVVIYYFKDLSLALGQTDRVPLVLSVWIPIIAISLFCCIGIIQINEK